MATSLNLDIPNAFKLSPSITVSKPSDSVATVDAYSKTASDASNLFKPLKMSTDSFKSELGGVMDGLKDIQKTASKYTGFLSNTSIFTKGANGAMGVNPANLLQGLMKLDSRVANSVKGLLSVPGIKGMGAMIGTAVMVGNLVQNLKKTNASTASGIFQLFSAVTGININPKILDKGPLNAAMVLIFGESAKNNVTGMWANFKRVDLYASIGLNVARSLSKVIIKYGDVDLLKDISEDAYKYALLESDSRLLYNFAAYYKLPQGATNAQINEIFKKFDTAANNLRPNWSHVTVNGVEQIDGYFITYASEDFIKMLRIYVETNAITKFDDETIFGSSDTYTLTANTPPALVAATALHGLAANGSFYKAYTAAQVQSTLGISIT